MAGQIKIKYSGAYYVPNPEWDTPWAFPTLKAYNKIASKMIFDTHSSLSVYSFILSISVVLTRPITSPCNRFLSHFPWALTPCTRLLSPASSRYLLFLATLNWLEIDLFQKSESCSVVFASLWHSPWNAPGQNTKVGSLSLLQGIFPTQESNPGPPLPHCRRIILYQLSHQGSPRILE